MEAESKKKDRGMDWDPIAYNLYLVEKKFIKENHVFS